MCFRPLYFRFILTQLRVSARLKYEKLTVVDGFTVQFDDDDIVLRRVFVEAWGWPVMPGDPEVLWEGSVIPAGHIVLPQHCLSSAIWKGELSKLSLIQYCKL